MRVSDGRNNSNIRNKNKNGNEGWEVRYEWQYGWLEDNCDSFYNWMMLYIEMIMVIISKSSNDNDYNDIVNNSISGNNDDNVV